jgi:hypothetical protein
LLNERGEPSGCDDGGRTAGSPLAIGEFKFGKTTNVALSPRECEKSVKFSVGLKEGAESERGRSERRRARPRLGRR